MLNGLEAIRKFIFAEDDRNLIELYKLALNSAAQRASQLGFQPSQFNSLEETKLFIARLFLIDKLRFDESSQLKITQLAMKEAVLGDTPKITLVLQDGKLISPSEEQIKNAVDQQFSSNDLILELLVQNKISLDLKINL